MQLNVFGRHSSEGESDWNVTHQLVDRTVGELGMHSQQCPLAGVSMQDVNRCRQLVASGVGTGSEQSGGEHEKFIVTEAVAILLGTDQV